MRMSRHYLDIKIRFIIIYGIGFDRTIDQIYYYYFPYDKKRLLKIYNFNRINVLYFYSERNRI